MIITILHFCNPPVREQILSGVHSTNVTSNWIRVTWVLSFPSFLTFLPDVFNFGIHLVIWVQGFKPELTSAHTTSFIRIWWLHIAISAVKKWFCFIYCDASRLYRHPFHSSSLFNLQDDASKDSQGQTSTNCDVFSVAKTLSVTGTICTDKTGNTWLISSHMPGREFDLRSEILT